SATCAPARASTSAAMLPAGPAPTTTASNPLPAVPSFIGLFYGIRSASSTPGPGAIGPKGASDLGRTAGRRDVRTPERHRGSVPSASPVAYPLAHEDRSHDAGPRAPHHQAVGQ